MISVLILDGYSDPSLCIDNSILSDICDIYIPLLVGILRYNGIACEVTKQSRLQKLYDLNGRTNDNLIYVPFFSCCDEKSAEISFIYTDSVSASVTSFRIASKLRKRREDILEKVVFVNPLQDGNILKKYTPILVDNIRFLRSAAACDNTERIYKTAVTTAQSVCEHYGVIFRDPANI